MVAFNTREIYYRVYIWETKRDEIEIVVAYGSGRPESQL